MGGFLQSLCRCLTVNSIYHHLLRLDCLDCLQPRTDVFLSSVVHALSLISSTHEHRLDDDMSVEGFHVFYDTLHVIGAAGPVCLLDICLVHCVQLQDVVIYPHQGIMNLLSVASYPQQIIKGLIIIGAVVMNGMTQKDE